MKTVAADKHQERNLSGQDLRQRDFSGADLRGANLRRADLRGANFSRASLTGADLRDADLSDSNLTQASLRGADLCGAVLNSTNLEETNLRGANLSGVNLMEALLDGADLVDATLNGVNLEQAVLNGADLSGQNLRYLKSLRGAQLNKANLSGADLSGLPPLYYVDLRGANLRGANLSGQNLTFPQLRGADLRKANLSGAWFNDSENAADLSETNLSGQVLSGRDLSHVDLGGADLTNANLAGTNLSGTNLIGAKGMLFDNNSITGARLSPRPNCPWYKLLQSYTGTSLIFVLVFSISALAPFALKAIYYAGLGEVERQSIPWCTAAIDKAATLILELPDPPEKSAQWARAVKAFMEKRSSEAGDPADQVAQVMALASQAPAAVTKAKEGLSSYSQELLEAEDETRAANLLVRAVRPNASVKKRRVVELLIGAHKGYGPLLLAVALILYNALRLVLTYFVGPLRQAQEISQFTPTTKQYMWLWQLHRVAAILFWVSIAAGLWQMWTVLSATVYVPA